jgi:hypothetical protein
VKNQGHDFQRQVADFYPLTRAQYYDLRSRANHLSGEARLLFAVLVDAIRCAALYSQSGSTSKTVELREAMAWVNSRSHHSLFSFESICGVLEIEPDSLRSRLNNTTSARDLRNRRLDGIGRSMVLSIPR